jgi:DNA gyrase/topoisomerase IV subunit B
MYIIKSHTREYNLKVCTNKQLPFTYDKEDHHMPKIKDDKITIIESDVKKIQTRPTMYISSLGEMGVLHLCKEIIDNNRDECFKEESPGNTIHIEITDDYIMSKDNGRGIPTKLLRVVHETNQAGSNMTRSHGTTAGENGTGTTAVLAMSSYLKVITLRPSEKKRLTLVYKDGELESETLEDYKEKASGLITVFKPSKKILGVSKIPVDLLVSWIEDFAYTLPTNINMFYSVHGEQRQIHHKNLNEYFDQFIPEDKRMSVPVIINTKGKLKEIIQDKEYDRKFNVEACVMYSDPSYHGEDIRKSWMNMIWTVQNGSHVNGVINGLSRYLTDRVIKRNKKLEEDGDLKRDILSHLHVVVKATCDYAHMFSSQAKSTVFPRQLTTAITEAVYKELCDMNQTKLNDLVEIVIQNNRVRKEGERVRNIASETKKKQWSTPDSYLPCASIKTPQPKEIFLCEGKSARGGISSARNAKFQAILMFQGKAPNVWDMTLDQALKSTVWFDMVKLLGCGIGSNFDIKKLNFDKIIIATDADVDGYHIRVSICAFFLRFMPELLEAGKVYIAEPPLYKLMRGKNISYVASQTEYIQECIRSVGNIQLEFPEVKD